MVDRAGFEPAYACAGRFTVEEPTARRKADLQPKKMILRLTEGETSCEIRVNSPHLLHRPPNIVIQHVRVLHRLLDRAVTQHTFHSAGMLASAHRIGGRRMPKVVN